MTSATVPFVAAKSLPASAIPVSGRTTNAVSKIPAAAPSVLSPYKMPSGASIVRATSPRTGNARAHRHRGRADRERDADELNERRRVSGVDACDEPDLLLEERARDADAELEERVDEVRRRSVARALEEPARRERAERHRTHGRGEDQRRRLRRDTDRERGPDLPRELPAQPRNAAERDARVDEPAITRLHTRGWYTQRAG